MGGMAAGQHVSPSLPASEALSEGICLVDWGSWAVDIGLLHACCTAGNTGYVLFTCMDGGRGQPATI